MQLDDVVKIFGSLSSEHLDLGPNLILLFINSSSIYRCVNTLGVTQRRLIVLFQHRSGSVSQDLDRIARYKGKVQDMEAYRENVLLTITFRLSFPLPPFNLVKKHL